MINLLIGPPGGGKSYEAVVFHVLPTIELGRKIITNLPLNIDEIAKIEPRARTLIEIRTKSKADGCLWAFGSVEDYGDDWRDPHSNIGPLYVIDECHKPLPRRGMMDRDPRGRLVDEWYAEHRHEGADVLLMTQSYGKVSKAIVDQVQICYRVKKKTAFGDSSGYIRKVQDGVRGDVLSTAERVYEPKWFRLYKSHTRTQAAVIEADAKDVSPAFLKWRKAGRVVLGLGIVWMLAVGLSAFSGDDEPGSQPSKPAAARTQEHGDRPASVATSPPTPLAAASPALPAASEPSPEPDASKPTISPPGTPFAGLGLHIAGSISKAGQRLYLFVLSQNGQPIHELRSSDITDAGYQLEGISDCVARLTYDGAKSWFVRCDSPKIGANVAMKSPSS